MESNNDFSCGGKKNLKGLDSWLDAEVGLRHIQEGQADGNTCALRLRAYLQTRLYFLGSFVYRHSGKFLFIALVFFSICLIGLKGFTVETRLDELWIEEGGRLQTELAHTERILGAGNGAINHLILQTSPDNILNQKSLQLHLKALQSVTELNVFKFGRTWRFTDLCLKPAFPIFEQRLVDQTIEALLPCTIITPLDCFWDASKLFGPESTHVPYLDGIKWTAFRPKQFLQQMSMYSQQRPGWDMLVSYMDKSGVSDGYMSKPCLDTTDPLCPGSLPNFRSEKSIDYGSFLSKGCQGFATKYMNWPRDLIVGGITTNQTGNIISAKALQSVIMLMGEKDLYEMFRDTTEVSNMDWSVEQANELLLTWQDEVDQVINKVTKSSPLVDQLLPFSEFSFSHLLAHYSTIDFIHMIIAGILLVAYVTVVSVRCTDPIHSQVGITAAGVLLVLLSTAASVGICAWIGLKFSAASTHVLVLLILGLFTYDVFFLKHVLLSVMRTASTLTPQHIIGSLLKRGGITLIVPNVCIIICCALGTTVPIPVLHDFLIQVAVVTGMNLVSVLILYPALLGLDIFRQHSKRWDVLCCVHSNRPNSTGTSAGLFDLPHPSTSDSPVAVSATVGQFGVPSTCVSAPVPPPPPHSQPPPYSVAIGSSPDEQPFIQQVTYSSGDLWRDSLCPSRQYICCPMTVTSLIDNRLAPLLLLKPTKVFVLVLFLLLLGFGLWGSFKLKDGLYVSELVPQKTTEHDYLQAQQKYFSFYNTYLVTMGEFDYANNQELLYSFYKSFLRVKGVMRPQQEGSPTFWMEAFRTWLDGIQTAFDEACHKGQIGPKGLVVNNASIDALIAYQLLRQTGGGHDVDGRVSGAYCTKTRPSQTRLVTRESGIINPDGFYNYLTAWVANDPLGYAVTEALLHPRPQRYTLFSRSDISSSGNPVQFDNVIPKAPPIVFAQIPIHFIGLETTEQIVEALTEIRSICDKYTNGVNGVTLKSYPRGVMVTYWEQYLTLRQHLVFALALTLGIMFFVFCVILFNPWTAVIVVILVASLVTQLMGCMNYLLSIQLSAVPAVVIILASGIGVKFISQIVFFFSTALGTKRERVQVALLVSGSPLIHGAVSSMIPISMLIFTQFDFVFNYFFLVLLTLFVLCVFNGLFVLPVLLSVLGPNAEVVIKGNLFAPTPVPPSLPPRGRYTAPGDCVPLQSTQPPPPQPANRPAATRPPFNSRRVLVSLRNYPRVPSEISLTTISEEPSELSSSCSERSVHAYTENHYSELNETTARMRATPPPTFLNGYPSTSEIARNQLWYGPQPFQLPHVYPQGLSPYTRGYPVSSSALADRRQAQNSLNYQRAASFAAIPTTLHETCVMRPSNRPQNGGFAHAYYAPSMPCPPRLQSSAQNGTNLTSAAANVSLRGTIDFDIQLDEQQQQQSASDSQQDVRCYRLHKKRRRLQQQQPTLSTFTRSMPSIPHEYSSASSNFN